MDGASRTAEYVAFFRALESQRPGAAFRDPDARRFLSRRLALVVDAAGVPAVADAVAAYVDRRWPGPRVSAVRRTAMIDDAVRDAVAAGCTQVVLLGAGYDTRAHRLPELAGLPVFEADLPATQARKRAVMGDGRVTYVPVDFARDDLGEAMRRAGLDAGQRTVIVWEGVLSYLELDAIRATLRWMATGVAPDSRAVVTYVRSAGLADGGRSWITAVADLGEPFVTGLDPATLADFMADNGLHLLHDAASDDAGFYGVAVCRT